MRFPISESPPLQTDPPCSLMHDKSECRALPSNSRHPSPAVSLSIGITRTKEILSLGNKGFKCKGSKTARDLIEMRTISQLIITPNVFPCLKWFAEWVSDMWRFSAYTVDPVGSRPLMLAVPEKIMDKRQNFRRTWWCWPLTGNNLLYLVDPGGQWDLFWIYMMGWG